MASVLLQSGSEARPGVVLGAAKGLECDGLRSSGGAGGKYPNISMPTDATAADQLLAAGLTVRQICVRRHALTRSPVWRSVCHLRLPQRWVYRCSQHRVGGAWLISLLAWPLAPARLRNDRKGGIGAVAMTCTKDFVL